jgi:antitoxin (DNA-binding transcriptional repressor) of toxin-antitoxin stability system
MSKSKLKARMLDVFRTIERTGESVVVTDRGRPTLRIEPIHKKRRVEDVFGHLRGKVSFIGDPDEPTTEEWEDP